MSCYYDVKAVINNFGLNITVIISPLSFQLSFLLITSSTIRLYAESAIRHTHIYMYISIYIYMYSEIRNVATILFNHHSILFDVEGQHLLENYPFGNVYLHFCCKNTPFVFMLLHASAFHFEKWMQHDNIIIITLWISNIANMISEGPLNKMVPLTEDHGGGGCTGTPVSSRTNKVSRVGTSNDIPHILWDIITCPCPWYLILVITCPCP